MANPDQGEIRRPDLSVIGLEGNQPISDLHRITADQIEGRSRKTIVRLEQFEDKLKPEGNTFLSWLEQEIKHESATRVAQAVGINVHTLLSIAKGYGIPILSQVEATKANWQNPEFREMRSRQVSAEWHDPNYAARRLEGLRARWQDPEYRERQAKGTRAKWQEPEYREKMSEQMRAQRQDPEFLRKRVESVKARWQDPEFRKRNAEATGSTLRAKWQEPEYRRGQIEASKARWRDDGYRERVADGIRAKWQEPEYREKMSEVARQTRLDPRNIGRYSLPTIHGDRWDVGFAQSAWEANLGRVIRLSGRDYLQHESLRLESGSLYDIDFLTIDGRNRMVAYEIMVHPLEDPVGWSKLEEVIKQYPDIAFRIVDRLYYGRLRKRFRARVNNDDRFAGWEVKGDNLRTNPAKYQ